jgi:hypothetical protein
MINVYKENVVRYLFALADYESQKRIWIEGFLKPGDTAISFSEGWCTVYDDTGLGDALNAGQSVFNAAADQALHNLSDALRKVDYKNKPDSAIIDTPAMQDVRDKAQAALRLILQSDFS